MTGCRQNPVNLIREVEPAGERPLVVFKLSTVKGGISLYHRFQGEGLAPHHREAIGAGPLTRILLLMLAFIFLSLCL